MAQPPRLASVLLPPDVPVIYWITLCVQHRQHVLANADTFAAITQAIMELRRWFVLSAVLMPDHFHALVSPREDRDLAVGDFFTGFKRVLRQRLKHAWNWQRSGFDRLLRSNDDAQEKWIYMRENPVRAGLAGSWEDWPFYFDYREKPGEPRPHL